MVWDEFAATWMDLEIIIVREVSQRKTNVILYHLDVEPKKKKDKEFIYKTVTDSQILKTNLCFLKGKGGWRYGLRFWG